MPLQWVVLSGVVAVVLVILHLLDREWFKREIQILRSEMRYEEKERRELSEGAMLHRSRFANFIKVSGYEETIVREHREFKKREPAGKAEE